MEQSANSNGKTAAIVSYITIIGWLISYFALNNPKTSIGSYHLRQTLLLFICGIAYQIITIGLTMAMPFLGLILWVGYIGFLVLWIMGLIAAINGEEKPMPLIGEKAQELFKGL